MSAVSGSEREQALVAQGGKPPLAVPRRLLRMRSDATLAERFAAGDEAAFDVIYERHRPVVLAVCMGVLGTPPDAEDATQETFSALAVALRTRPPAELRPWLIRVARNASIDTTRRRRHRLLTLDGEIPEVAARPHGSGQAELAVVLDGIRELPEGQRMALLMRELGGHSYTEIAEFLATDEEAVKGLIARARVGLRTYREATELSCTSARSTIAAEPDGRRYDKTIRRHLRGCASCRGYREALRDDARALRAALPIQAGTVATGSLSGGMLSAAKGSLITYGLTQAATTCAASACAVGAIGGMVFVAPVHRLGVWPILAPTVHKHAAAPKAPAKHRAAPAVHKIVTVSHPESTGYVPAATTEKPAVTHPAVVRHHRRHVTWVALPTLTKHPRHHHHGAAAPVTSQTSPTSPASSTAQSQAPAQNAVNAATQNPAPTQNADDAATQNQAPTTQNADNPAPVSGQDDQGQGHANWSSANAQAGSNQTAAPTDSSPSSQAASDQSSQAGSNQGWQSGYWHGNGNGNGHGHNGDPRHTIVTAPGATASAAAASSAASSTAPTVPSTTPTVPSTTTTVPSTTTTATSTTSQGSAPGWAGSNNSAWSGAHGGGHGHGHGGWAQQSGPTPPSGSTPPSSPTPPSSSAPQSATTPPSATTPQSSWGQQSGSTTQGSWGQQSGGGAHGGPDSQHGGNSRWSWGS